MAKQDDEGRLAEKRLLLSSEDHQILRDFLDVQKQRIVMESRRADVATKALEIADVQDQRRFEFASKTHDDSVALEKEKLKRVSGVVWALLGWSASWSLPCSASSSWETKRNAPRRRR